MIRLFGAALVSLLLLPESATAQEREYCSTRPSIGQSPCVLERGRVAIETALVDWERDIAGDSATDTFLLGDSLLRIGLSDHVEAQVNWSPIGIVRERSGGTVERRTRVGDLSLGSRINLGNPDGSGLSFGLQPSITIPVGGSPVGAPGWGAELIVPVSVELSDGLALQFSPTIAAEPHEGGRHLRYGNIAGVEWSLTDRVALSLEGQVERDDDPEQAATFVAGAASVGWMANPDLQLDAGGVFGLNADTPDVRLYLGISRRF